MKLLITGSNGLLGQKIVKRCIRHGIPFIATSKGGNRNPDCPDAVYLSMDISSADEVQTTFAKVRPTAVIHTAAITNVDYCEQHPEECMETNVEAVRLLWETSRQFGCHFQLLSTDFVFDGEKGHYSETDAPSPLSVYARSKVAAEQVLLEDTTKNWSIVRTIIVFGTGHQLSRSNLVLWALEALPKGEPMRLVNDQFRAPTWADDLAYGCVSIIERDEQGIFHLSGPDTYSVAELVQRIASVLGLADPAITTISSAALNQPAKRPPRTGFDLTKAAQLLDYHPHSFEDAVRELIAELS